MTGQKTSQGSQKEAVERVPRCGTTLSGVKRQRGKGNSFLLLLSERALWVREVPKAASAEPLGSPALHLPVSIQSAR